jgi:hypothetical protein
MREIGLISRVERIPTMLASGEIPCLGGCVWKSSTASVLATPFLALIVRFLLSSISSLVTGIARPRDLIHLGCRLLIDPSFIKLCFRQVTY